MQLRPYQREVIADLQRTLVGDCRRLILQAPTGAGKTLISCALIVEALRYGRRVIFTVPRAEILGQTTRKLAELGVPHYTLEGGGSLKGLDKSQAQVMVAMAPTLYRRVNRWAADWEPSIVIVDECHYAPLQAQRILKRWPNIWLVGLTATPVRADDKMLDALYQKTVTTWPISQLQEHGYLVRARTFSSPSANLAEVRVRAGEYASDDLGRAFGQQILLGDAVKEWQDHANGRRTITFCPTVEVSRELAQRYRASGVRAEHVDASTSDDARKGALDRLRRHEIDVLCNVGLFVEGLDLVEVECIQLFTATKSLARYIQMVGRGLRPSPHTGKQNLLVLDHGNNAMGGGDKFHHGLPDQDRDWTDPEPNKKKRAPVMCPQCKYLSPPATLKCPECGYQLRIPEEAKETQEGRGGPVIEPGRLVELTQEAIERALAAEAKAEHDDKPDDLAKARQRDRQRAREQALADRAAANGLSKMAQMAKDRDDSRRTPPRPCPPEWRVVGYEWHRQERLRQQNGYALPGPLSYGFTEGACLRKCKELELDSRSYGKFYRPDRKENAA